MISTLTTRPDAIDPTATPRRAAGSLDRTAKVVRLNHASSRRPIEPDSYLPWGTLGDGQVIADELLTVAGLNLRLDEQQRRRLSREETAAMLTMGVRFEATLNAGFSQQVANATDLANPRVTYMLHEIGEEARHSRAFVRLIGELEPTATNPLAHGPIDWVATRVARSVAKTDVLLLVMILAGEEIPDLLQKRACEHPSTDPMLAALNRYHRMEEARHLAYARTILPEAWARAGRAERARVRHAAPVMINQLWQMFVHPGVYETVGLAPFPTWRAVNRLPGRIALRKEALRPVLAALITAGVLEPGRIPRGWRQLCGVDASGSEPAA